VDSFLNSCFPHTSVATRIAARILELSQTQRLGSEEEKRQQGCRTPNDLSQSYASLSNFLSFAGKRPRPESRWKRDLRTG